jgi:hypothetical protein
MSVLVMSIFQLSPLGDRTPALIKLTLQNGTLVAELLHSFSNESLRFGLVLAAGLLARTGFGNIALNLKVNILGIPETIRSYGLDNLRLD